MQGQTRRLATGRWGSGCDSVFLCCVAYNTTMPCAGLVEPWEARLGQLDAGSGEFTPREAPASAAGSLSSEGFCGFMGPGAVYVGVPGMDATCRGPCSSHPGLTTRFGERVRHSRAAVLSVSFTKPLQTRVLNDVHAQVTHAERVSSTGLWRLQSETAGDGFSSTAAVAYAGIILADPMVAAKGACLLTEHSTRCSPIVLQLMVRPSDV